MDEGVRTLDRRSHNPELYQLSYVHHIREVPAGTLLLTSTLLVRRVRYQSAINEMARPAGLEPATIRLEGGCSIQLSYGRFYLHSVRSADLKLRLLKEVALFVSHLTQQQAVLDKRGECYRGSKQSSTAN